MKLFHLLRLFTPFPVVTLGAVPGVSAAPVTDETPSLAHQGRHNHSCSCAPSGTRTHNTRILSPSSLPFGLPELERGLIQRKFLKQPSCFSSFLRQQHHGCYTDFLGIPIRRPRTRSKDLVWFFWSYENFNTIFYDIPISV